MGQVDLKTSVKLGTRNSINIDFLKLSITLSFHLDQLVVKVI